MVVFPPCKINLGLRVIARRSDGFHDLETCFYPIPWTDVLEIVPATDFHFKSTGIIIPGKPEENLCVKAYTLLQRDFDLSPVHIHLHKIIPSGAGLGGGSSDAAHTLRVLNALFSLHISQTQLAGYASALGSDCAFFIYDEPMTGSGRGEVLEPVPLSLKGKFLVIVKPDVHVSTATAFSGIVPAVPEQSVRSIIEKGEVATWSGLLKNDFEESIFRKHPVIAAIKQKLYDADAQYASMSGSGAAVFGIFDKHVDLRESFRDDVYWDGWV